MSSVTGLKFFKMTGGGNDFIVFDNRGAETDVTPEWVRRVCRRGLSVGADGVIALEKSRKAQFRMRYYNADGEEAAFCGNGIRCAARYAFLKVIAPRDMRIETMRGVRRAQIDGETVSVELELLSDEAPRRVEMGGGGAVEGYFLRVGVPHFVVFTEDLEAIAVGKLGAALRWHPDFGPEGANVTFAKTPPGGGLELRSYERGIEGETLACGSGAACAAVAALRLELTDFPMPCLTRGGAVLTIDGSLENGAFTGLRLSGEARVVYAAELGEEF